MLRICLCKDVKSTFLYVQKVSSGKEEKEDDLGDDGEDGCSVEGASTSSSY
jgi:hypothetical protein